MINCLSYLDATIWMGASREATRCSSMKLCGFTSNSRREKEDSLPQSVGCDDQQRCLPGSGIISNWGIKQKCFNQKRIKIMSYFSLFVFVSFSSRIFWCSRLCPDRLDTFHVYSIGDFVWSCSYFATAKYAHALCSCHHRGRYVFIHSATREDDVLDQNVISTW